MFDDNHPTTTSRAQDALEKKILPSYQELDGLEGDELDEYLELNRLQHVSYLQTGLGQLSAGFAVLDASRPWIVYWLVHSLALLDAPLPKEVTADDISNFLGHCQHPDGGFGGSPLQIAHLAPTYAAVAALVTLGTKRAYEIINRAKVWDFLLRMCVPPEKGGGFNVHDGGEGDLRACYTAMAVAHMLCLDKAELATRSGLLDYVKRCQTFEGGLGGEPGNEAHGGYTYCGVAALALAGPGCIAAALDVPRLLRWLVLRQGPMEGGFNGRTNKLVDGCYSFWQGGVFPLLLQLPHEALSRPSIPADQVPAEPLAVPVMPMVNAQAPTELADEEMSNKMMQLENTRAEAQAASEAADAALQGVAARHSREQTEAARLLLDAANKSHEIAETAAMHFACVSNAAYLICPLPPDPAEGAAAAPSSLFNVQALQLWILKCCQPSKGGGLRDKPGKSVDFYHSCYCLSGLSAAQHLPGARVLGPRENLLRKADPAVNVVEDKLAAALRYFGQRPPMSPGAACPAPMETGA